MLQERVGIRIVSTGRAGGVEKAPRGRLPGHQGKNLNLCLLLQNCIYGRTFLPFQEEAENCGVVLGSHHLRKTIQSEMEQLLPVHCKADTRQNTFKETRNNENIKKGG